MVRAPCCEKMGLKKGPWTPEEDQILISYIHKHGHGNWRALPKQAGLLRCGKSCRLRWTNYLKPDIKRGNFTKEEEETIIKLHEKLGNRWAAIAARLPRRTDNEIKNVWHTHLKKKLNYYQPSQTTKRHSCTTKKKGDNFTGAPVSPQDSASEISSVTDSSGGNMNSNWVEIKQEEMDSSEYLPQIDESFWSEDVTEEQFSRSSEMSSSVTNGDQLIIKHEEMDSSEHFPQIDESFWSEELPVDDSNTQSDFHGVIEESHFQYPSSSNDTTMLCDKVCSSKIEDDMDFWFNLFIKAGDLPDLPQF